MLPASSVPTVVEEQKSKGFSCCFINPTTKKIGIACEFYGLIGFDEKKIM